MIGGPEHLPIAATNLLSALPTQQAATDTQLVDLWLHGRSEHTQRAYRGDGERFMAFADGLGTLAPASQARILAAVKSLLSFAHRLGYVPFDVGKALKLPPRKATLAERILPEADVQRMLALEGEPRNKAMLLLFFAAGIRVSELVALRWRDVQPRGDADQVTIYGKGGKTRAILLPSGPWRELQAQRKRGGLDDPVFVSRASGHLDPSQVRRIVLAAARRAGITLPVSCHWLHHAHASHALDRGCPIHLVQATLGHASVTTTGKYLHVRPSESSGKYLAV